MQFSENDSTLPLALSREVFDGQVYSPMSGLVGYVNALYTRGFRPETISRAYSDLYLLDYYYAQVCNGGNSQFVANSGRDVLKNLAAARRGADILDIPEMAELIDACTEWVVANPEEAARQTGFDVRAEALNALDSPLYALNYTEEAFEAALDGMPDEMSRWLAPKLRQLEGAEEALARFADRAVELSREFMPSTALAKAEPEFADVLDWNVRRSYGTKEKLGEEMWEHHRGSFVTSVGHWLDKVWDTITPEKMREKIISGLQSVIKPGMYDRSIYHIKSALWIRQHPNLEMLEQEAWQSRVDAIVASSPFTAQEMRARELDALDRLLPNADSLALAAAFGKLRRRDGTGPLMAGITYSYKDNTETKQRHFVKTSEGELALTKDGTNVSLAVLRASRSFPVIKQARLLGQQFGLVSQLANLQFIGRTPARKAGRVLARATQDPALPGSFRELYVLEAVHLWSQEPSDKTQFQRGALDAHEAGRALCWRFALDTGQVVIEADADGVRFTGAGRDAKYPRAVLAAWRADRQRPEAKPA